MKSNRELRKLAEELYDSGTTSVKQIVDIVYNTHGYDRGVDSLYGTALYWIKEKKIRDENPALSAECEQVGIPFESVKHGWYKGKHWSLAFKPENDAPDFEKMLQDHIEHVDGHTFKYDTIKREINPTGNLLVIDPADIHIGKLASSFETGEEYNNQIAVQRVLEGVDGILSKSAGFNIDQIIFVAGNDVLHVDSPKRTTTSGTPQDTDGMWYDNFLIAKKLYVDVIDRLMQIADVHFMYNPSNHDYTHGFFLADSIKSWYRDCDNITFDSSINHRKYFTYGNSLIGTTHGDGAKWQDLGKLAAVESPDWSATKHRYVYTHHVHHKIVKDDIGVTIESLRSPSGTDGWHHRNGYQHAPKAVEGFIHSKEHGQVARFTHLF
jgi:hypothetical protein